jgi:hypothetical protein
VDFYKIKKSLLHKNPTGAKKDPKWNILLMYYNFKGLDIPLSAIQRAEILNNLRH